MIRFLCSGLGLGLLMIFQFGSLVSAQQNTPPSAFTEVPGFERYTLAAEPVGLSRQEYAPGKPIPANAAPNQMQTLLRPSESLDPTDAVNRAAQAWIEIEVSHSSHAFKMFDESGLKRELLFECKIGLGAPEFPTPQGTYYVTHIYDQKPWWIPPKDRAWAAGDSPSQKVYGGTMAPLLKKRMASQRKTGYDGEDLVAGEVKLDDYGYRFHGTSAPRSIGRNQSHGCVRMLSSDAEKVANMIKEKVGILERKESENGPYVVLKTPVKLHLVR